MINSLRKPLMIAAKKETLLHLRSCFPEAKTWQLRTDVTVFERAQWADVVRQIESLFQMQLNQSVEALVDHLIASIQMQGPAVAGSHASLRAIQQRQVHHLVITEKTLYAPVLQGIHNKVIALPGINAIHAGEARILQTSTNSTRYSQVIEACWMAFRQKLPVFQAKSDELQLLGGIGCVLVPDEQPDQIIPAFATGILDLQLAA